MIDFSTPLAALGRAAGSVGKVAARIARTGETPEDSVNLSSDAVALLVARQNYEANIKSIQTADQMSRSLLDVLG